ncbi:lipopolysaccharide biosynthesis protein [Rufibacter soli]
MLKGVLWDLVEKFSNQGVSLGISIILARLLSPEEFGLIGMVMVIIGMSQMFLDMGFGSALVQRQDVTNKHYSSVFFINILVGALLTIALYFSSPLISSFYERPELEDICKALSFLFLIDSFIIVQYTIFAKELNFKTPAIVRVTSTLLSGMVGVYLAYNGFGVWSLVIQSLIGAVLSVSGIWIGSSWKPILFFDSKIIRELWSFGSKMFASGVIDSVFSRLDVLIIGKIFSANTLGFYTRAQSFNNLVIQYTSGSLARVFFPTISNIQHDLKEVKELYMNVISIVSFLVFGLLGFFYLSAEDLFVFLFTDKWLPAVKYFQILMLGGYAFPLNNIMISILSGRGKSNKFLKLELFKKGLLCLAFGSGLLFGIYGFLYSLVIVYFFMLLLNIYFVKNEIDLTMSSQLREIFQYCLISIIIVAPLTYYSHYFSDYRLIALIQAGISFLVLYLILNLLFKTKVIVLLKVRVEGFLSKR